MTTPEILPGINETVANVAAIFIRGGNIYFISSPLDNIKQKMWIANTTDLNFHVVEDFPRPLVTISSNSLNTMYAIQYLGPYSCSLYISEDFGDTWRLVMDRNIVCGSVSWSQFGQNPNRIYATAAFTLTGIVIPYWNFKLIYSDDLFETYETITDRITEWNFAARSIVSKRLLSHNNNSYVLHFNSEDDLYDFKNINFTGVNDAKIDKIYDSRYTKSIVADVEFNNGSRGIFRTFDLNDPFELILEHYDDINIQPLLNFHGGYLMNRNEENLTQTFFSYDFGETWEHVSLDPTSDLPEEIDDDSIDINDLTITLDLDKTLIYSPDLPGTVIGTGYIHLKNETHNNHYHTLISIDGGKSWSHLRDIEDKHVYINSRGLMFMFGENSNFLKYSLNNGYEWEICQLFEDSEYNVTIKKVTSSLEDSRDAVLLYARRSIKQDDDSYTYENLLIHINGRDLPECTDDDYTYWSPQSENQCANGMKQTYKQRRFDRKCIYSKSFRHEIQDEFCPCTDRDFKCKDPYYYDEKENRCIHYKDIQNLELLGKKYVNCTIFETVPNVLVKRKGNLCDESLSDSIPQIEGVVYKCEEVFPLKSSHNNNLILNMKWSIISLIISILVLYM